MGGIWILASKCAINFWDSLSHLLDKLISCNCDLKKHKHAPEMAKHSKLGRAPIFQPAVGAFPQGMVVSVPIFYDWLKPGVSGSDIHDAWQSHYAGCNFVKVMPRGENAIKEANLLERGAFLRPDTLANTNLLELFLFDNDNEGKAVLCARLDNLGKGASGAAVQNLNIALGIEETAGLDALDFKS